MEAAILDTIIPAMSGLVGLGRFHAQQLNLPGMVLSGHAGCLETVLALKLGAFDFIAKGLDRDLSLLAVHGAARRRRETIPRGTRPSGCAPELPNWSAPTSDT